MHRHRVDGDEGDKSPDRKRWTDGNGEQLGGIINGLTRPGIGLRKGRRRRRYAINS